MFASLMRSRRFAPIFWCQFFSAFNDNFLKNALVFLILFAPGVQNREVLITLTAAVNELRASRSAMPGANRIRNTRAFFRKLSLKAEKNWHQNRGAKRRVVISEVDMGSGSGLQVKRLS